MYDELNPHMARAKAIVWSIFMILMMGSTLLCVWLISLEPRPLNWNLVIVGFITGLAFLIGAAIAARPAKKARL